MSDKGQSGKENPRSATFHPVLERTLIYDPHPGSDEGYRPAREHVSTPYPGRNYEVETVESPPGACSQDFRVEERIATAAAVGGYITSIDAERSQAQDYTWSGEEPEASMLRPTNPVPESPPQERGRIRTFIRAICDRIRNCVVRLTSGNLFGNRHRTLDPPSKESSVPQSDIEQSLASGSLDLPDLDTSIAFSDTTLVSSVPDSPDVTGERPFSNPREQTETEYGDPGPRASSASAILETW